MNNRPTKTIFSAEHCEKIRQGHIGKKQSEETKRKIGESMRRRAELKKKSVGIDAHLSEAGSV